MEGESFVLRNSVGYGLTWEGCWFYLCAHLYLKSTQTEKGHQPIRYWAIKLETCNVTLVILPWFKTTCLQTYNRIHEKMESVS